MEWITVVMGLIGIVTGGSLIKIYDAYIKSKRQDNEDAKDKYDRVFERMEDENNRLNKEYNRVIALNDEFRNNNIELRKEIDKLKSSLYDLRNKVVLLESNSSNFPFPFWLKGTDGRMLSMNKACESVFLKNAGLTIEDAIGKTDVQVWGREQGEKLWNHDLTVLDAPSGSIVFVERVEDSIFVSMKFARKVGNAIIGINGAAICIDDCIDELIEAINEVRG